MTVHSITTSDSPWVIDGSGSWKGNAIAAGDTFEIAAGTYAGRLKLTNMPGTVANPITFTNTGGQAIFTGNSTYTVLMDDNNSYVTIDGSGHAGTTYGIVCRTDQFKIEDRADNITVRYVEFDTSTLIGFRITQVSHITTPNTNITVENCWFHDVVTEGCYLGNNLASATDYILSDIIVRDCLFEDCGEAIDLNGCHGFFAFRDNTILRTVTGGIGALNAAIAVSNSGAAGINGYIERNWIDNCDENGINFVESDGADTETVWIQNNVFLNCGNGAATAKHDGIRIQGAGPTVRAVNNTIRNTGNGTDGRGIRLSETRHYAVNNIVIESDVDDISLAVGVPAGNATNNLTSDTTGGDATTRTTASIAFINEAADDYRLTAASPAVDAGTATDAPTDDYLQNTRDSSPDVGAYEYIAAVAILMSDYRRRRNA